MIRLRLLGLAVGMTLGATATAVTIEAQQGPPSRRATPSAENSSSHANWTAPRTPWGDPDLQGLWPSIDMQGTPLERPAQFGDRATLTDEEFAQREQQSERQAEADSETVVNTQRPPRGTGTGPPSHWGERGKPSRRTSLIVQPANGRMPSMTPDGAARSARAYSTYFLDFPDAVAAHPFDDFTDLGPYDRCITRGLLASMLPTAYNMGNQIIQIPGFVVIRNEMIHETRVIPLDGRPHLGPGIRQYLGDSRGHWEGETLVIETTNFNGKVGLTRNGNTAPTSPDMRIVERLTRTAPDTITYEATIDDPKTWTAPWTLSLPLRLHPEYQFFEYACHEGNYAMKHILSGARTDDKGAAAKTGE